MIRPCTKTDFEVLYEIINDAAIAYKGVIPKDRWHEPYMSRQELRQEIEAGISFWGYEEEKVLAGVMGIQDKGEVTLIRHAYVRTRMRKHGIGSKLLQFLESKTEKPILIGTWADATWAIKFYQKFDYRLVPTEEKNRLLKEYWNIPKRQVETSVILAGSKWNGPTID